MKQILLLVLTTFFVVNIRAQVEPRFESYNTGQAFTAITVDGHNKKVWAGTTQAGVFSIDATGVQNATDFTIFNGSDPVSGPPLNNIRIKSMAADKLGNIWIGHQGISFSGVQGGLERINNVLNIKHYKSETNYTSQLGYNQQDGTATRRVTSISVGEDDKVWISFKYTDLTITGGGSTYLLQPGAFSYKSKYVTQFTTIGGWAPNRANGVPIELPFPAYTYNPPATATPGARTMDAISCDNTHVFVAVRGYPIRVTDTQTDGGYIPHRLLVYNLDGTFTNLGDVPTNMGFSYTGMGFPAGGGIINGICANNEKGTWVSKSLSGLGFSVYKNGSWQYMDPTNFSQVIPPNTRFNANAMWHDKLGRVFMGTDKGLIVYNGYGPVDNPDSYTLYTNYEYGTGNPRNVFDATMLSSNIKGGSADPKNAHRSWIATDTGIMKIFLPIEGMTMYHVKEDYTYGSTTVDTDENISLMTVLKNEISDGLITDSETPSVAADGSNATVFRFYTSDPAGFYNTGNESYKIFIGYPSSVGQIFTQDYIKQFGYFYLKSLDSYPGNITSPDQLKYVEFYYKQPEYIDANDYYASENYTNHYSLYILDVTDSANPIEVYKHPIKIAVPPILLGHGVWSSVSSMQPAEDYFLNHGFSDYTILKAWRTIDDADLQLPENAFEEDSWVIPTYIKRLKNKAAANMFSAGKVNIIVHSRAGLYTIGYIEGIDFHYPYRDDINALITIDTPHFGSQGGNIALDRRVVVYKETIKNAFVAISALTHIPLNILIEANDITLGQIASAASVPKRDNPRNGAEGKNWGARNLIVEIDNISGVVPPEDPGFISNLNRSGNISKLNGTPIHTISAEADPCIDNPIYCLNNEAIEETSPIKAKFVLIVKKMLPNAMSEGLRSVTQALFNGEPNDFIVPLTSMQGGLGGTRYNTHYGLDKNFDHTGMFREGVAKSPVVQGKILNLLRSNVKDETANGFFTQTGLNHSKLTYNFLETFLTPARPRNVALFTSKILINRDPAIFDNRIEGDVLNFNVYQEDVDSIMLIYENENDTENFVYTTKSQNLVFENAFSYTIPSGYSGELKITAYGFKNGIVGYAINEVTLTVGVPAAVSLQSIHFEQRDPTILNQDDYTYKVIGTYSDGIDREVTNDANLTFAIEDAAVTSQVNSNTIKADAVGTTLFTASLNGFEDTILVNVIENSSLQQTILTNFYGIPNVDNTAIDVNWETLREFQNATFVLETSYGTPDNFIEINQQAGNGTISTPAQFNYSDTTFGSNTTIYYRIKLIDTSGNFTYSSIIVVNLSTLGLENEGLDKFNLELYPNPAITNEVMLKLNSSLIDKNARLEMYSLQGKRLAKQALNVKEGNNTFKLKIGNDLPNGIYLVKVTTAGYVKTVKLIVRK